MSNWSQDQSAFMIAGEQTVGQMNTGQAWRYAKHLQEESKETVDALTELDYVKAVDGAVDSIVVAIGLLHSLGVDPNAAWNIVHKANMSKLVDGKVYKRPDGQIGKGPNFVPPEAELKLLVDAVLA